MDCYEFTDNKKSLFLQDVPHSKSWFSWMKNHVRVHESLLQPFLLCQHRKFSGEETEKCKEFKKPLSLTAHSTLANMHNCETTGIKTVQSLCNTMVSVHIEYIHVKKYEMKKFGQDLSHLRLTLACM